MGVITWIILSYDIACQWFRNLRKRMLRLPHEMWIPPNVFFALRSFIPKLHIYGHGDKCQYKYSFNYQKWSARTDGEDPERFWSHINPASVSTREMSPGARFDALDSHAVHWNWRKTVKFGTLMPCDVAVLTDIFFGFHRFIPCVTIVRSRSRSCTPSCILPQAFVKYRSKDY